jgi:hypothetical protein
MDFYAGIKPYPGEEPFAASTQRLWSRFSCSSLPSILRVAQEEFGGHEFGLEHVLPDTRQTIISSVFGSLLERLSQEYGRLYEDNQRTLEVLRVSGFELPPELRAVAEFSLGRQFDEEIRRQSGRTDPAAYQKAVDLAQEAARRGYRIDRSFAERLFDEMITEAVRGAVSDRRPATRAERAEPPSAEPQPPAVAAAGAGAGDALLRAPGPDVRVRADARARRRPGPVRPS